MTQHCTMEDLLAVRDQDGSAAATAHLAECDTCRHELELLRQRVGALRALPNRRPPRDRWLVVKEQALAARRRGRMARTAWASLAVAAGLTLAIGMRALTVESGPQVADNRPAARDATDPAPGSVSFRVADLVEQSQYLEATLKEYRPEGRVLSGRAASIIAELEDRIAVIDAGIARANAVRNNDRRQLVNLWRDRVELMDALVSTHVTRAAYVGF